MNVQKMIRVLTSPLQALETTLQDMLSKRDVNTAEGAQLDLLGKLVGAPARAGKGDEQYRRYVRAQIATNRSHGLVGNILTIARLVVLDAAARFALRAYPPASYALRVEDVAAPHYVAGDLATFVGAATSAGVRAHVVSNAGEPEAAFTFALGGGLGFAGPGTGGGALSSAREAA